ncbi:hypothetical protein [Spiroplasma endosymbiont of Labia minor]|uniref:hypothetical protein n=1 Tax=Spiroplasma endosymbiont of Labia minor TaxID=3066305 RepID=UPI0030D582A7
MSSLWIAKNEILISDLIYFSLLGNYIVNLSDDIKEIIMSKIEINIYLNELTIMFNQKKEIIKNNDKKFSVSEF